MFARSRSHVRSIRVPCDCEDIVAPTPSVSPSDRRYRTIRPVIEALEGRQLLAGTSPTNPVPIGPKPTGPPTPQELGAAYNQVLAIQAETLQSLGDSDRSVEAAGARLASRTAVAIDGLTDRLSTATSPKQANTIAAAIRRDRHLLNLGGAHAAKVEQGLDVARGVEDQQTNTDKIYIPNGLFTTLTLLVKEAETEGRKHRPERSKVGRRRHPETELPRRSNVYGDRPLQSRRLGRTHG